MNGHDHGGDGHGHDRGRDHDDDRVHSRAYVREHHDVNYSTHTYAAARFLPHEYAIRLGISTLKDLL